MKKQEFLKELEVRLSEISESDLWMTLQYYNEIIDEYMSEGHSEEAAISHLPRVDDIAMQILADSTLPRKKRIMHSQRESMKSEPERDPARKFSAWEILLIILTAPLWIAAVTVLAALVVAFFILCAALILAVYLIDFALAALAAAALLCLPIPALLHTGIPSLLLLIGVSFICGGLSILIFRAANRLSVSVLRFCKYMYFRNVAKFHERRVVA